MIDELDDVMTDFFQRSVKQNPATGIPKTFDIQTEVAEVKGTSFKEEPRVVSQTLPQKNVSPPKPTITSINPTSGPSVGGTHVDIVGDRFIPSCTVNFDGVPESSGGTFTDPQHIMAVAPAHIVGFVDVEVENVTGLSDELVNAYKYIDAPTVSSVSPTRGSFTGGSQVTIHGNFEFPSGYTVTFGTATVAAVRVSQTTLTCTVPHGPNGFLIGGHDVVDVKVTATDTQFGTLSNSYTYYSGGWAPAVPPSGSAHSGIYVTAQIVAWDDATTFDPTYNGSVILNIGSQVNIGAWDFDPGSVSGTPTIVNGTAFFQITASLANPTIDGSLQVRVDPGPGGFVFTLTVLH